METRRAVLRRAGRGALGGLLTLLAACSGPVPLPLSTPTATSVPPTPIPTATATPEPTRVPPRPQPAGTIGSGVRVATPAGTPLVRPGFARGHLRVIHAAPALPALVIVVDSTELVTVRYPEATVYTDIPYGPRRIEGLTATGGVFSTALDAGDAVAYTIVVGAEGGNPRTVVFVDDQPRAEPGRCRLRFLPLDAGAGPLDLALTAGATLSGGIAPYTLGPSVAAPVGTRGLEVRAPGRAAPLLTKPPLALDDGDRYTAVLSGSVAAQSLRLILYPDAAPG